MSDQSRRAFFKTAGAIAGGLSGLKSKPSNAGNSVELSEDRMGVLVDTTLCIGCRKCEYACKINHDLPSDPIDTYDDRSVFNEQRRPDAGALTVVNEYENPANPELPYNVKFQCMHCDHPACVSACIVGAFLKREDGSVVYDVDICIGCRYCMVACPFQVPAYEYADPLTPKVQKCDFCAERTSEGMLPACVEMCPVEALTYGKRYELLQVARDRIRKHPDRYVDHILGESEVGGTSWLYIAGKPFTEVGFPELGDRPAPGISESIQHGLFAYFVPPIALYSLLGGIMWLNSKKQTEED
jgi:Fe-S-cluster-containing dehydrogenase component